MTSLMLQSQQEKKHDGAIAVTVKVLGCIDDNTAYQLEEEMMSLLSRGIKDLTLVLSGIHDITCAGVATIIRIKEKFQRNGGDLELSEAPESILDIVEELSLLSFFHLSHRQSRDIVCPRCHKTEAIPVIYEDFGTEFSTKSRRRGAVLEDCVVDTQVWKCKNCCHRW